MSYPDARAIEAAKKMIKMYTKMLNLAAENDGLSPDRKHC